MTVALSRRTPETLTSKTSKDSGLGDCLSLVINTMVRRDYSRDRRREQRHAFPYPIRLRPAGRDGGEGEGASIVALGKSISKHGLEFYSHEAVPHRWMIASLPCGRDEFVEVLIDLEWCRFGREGYYTNVGRIRQVLDGEPPVRHAS